MILLPYFFLSPFAFWLCNDSFSPPFKFLTLNSETVYALIAKAFDVVCYCVRVLGRSASSFKYGPYIVTSLLVETTILWEPTLEAKALAAQKLLLNVWNLFVLHNLKTLKKKLLGISDHMQRSFFPSRFILADLLWIRVMKWVVVHAQACRMVSHM